jgi:hypothetical protein
MNRSDETHRAVQKRDHGKWSVGRYLGPLGVLRNACTNGSDATAGHIQGWGGAVPWFQQALTEPTLKNDTYQKSVFREPFISFESAVEDLFRLRIIQVP